MLTSTRILDKFRSNTSQIAVMKLTAPEERVHIIDCHTDVWSVIQQITDSGTQEEAFYVCDIGDIIRKHKIWTSTMPRVEPHYGMLYKRSVDIVQII